MLSDQLDEARGGIWPDIVQAARSMDRFDFIAEYLRRHTARKANRAHVDGYQVLKRRGKWTYRHETSGGGIEQMRPADANTLFDVVRRTPLARYIRDAEEFRILALSEGDLSHLHLLPGDKKLKKARVTRGDRRATPAGAGTKMRGKLPGYSQTVRHMTVGGGY